MSFSLNKQMLIGNLGQDAETRYTTNNVGVTSFSIATQNDYKGKDGNWVKTTTWHNVVGFNLSDYMKDQLKKGKKFYVEGRTSKRDYHDKEGIKRYVTEVIAETLIPLDANGNRDGREERPSADNYHRAPVNSSQYDGAGAGSNNDSSAEDDDLPF